MIIPTFFTEFSSRIFFKSFAKNASWSVPSCPSLPSRTSVKISASSAVSVKVPITSVLLAIAKTPQREINPYVGFQPKTPLKLAGSRMLPPVSDPSANGTTPAATIAALPPELPPATLVSSYAFFVAPKAEFSVEPPCAKASRLDFPIMIAPASSSFFTAVESIGLLKFAKNVELAVECPAFVKKLSLAIYGTPAKTPIFSKTSASVFVKSSLFFSRISRISASIFSPRSIA